MSAVLSPCGAYRYRLERRLFPLKSIDGASLAWIMVNPSTADASEDDATIRKVRGFSCRAGAARIVVGNLFAYRATDVRDLRTAPDPIGPENDAHLQEIMRGADAVVVAWGASAKLPRNLRDRWMKVANMAGFLGVPLQCLGVAQDGHPLHPLMQSYDRALVPWSPPEPLQKAA